MPPAAMFTMWGRGDMIEMAHRENILIYMRHPRSSPPPAFPSYRGIGFRWGMGLDGSAQPPPKYIQAISEVYGESSGDVWRGGAILLSPESEKASFVFFQVLWRAGQRIEAGMDETFPRPS
jgi:hypothetical protein